ncbi:MAG: Ig-like domain-containing protein [Betaproteobacteria bacterium]
MKRKDLAIAALLMAFGSVALAQTAAVATAAETSSEPSGYIGANTRVGIGYDDTTRLRGELYRVLYESGTSAVLGEAWLSRNAGGVKFSYNWLPEPAVGAADASVRKFFLAADRNTDGDAKLTLGGGIEKSSFFGGAYVSHAITGRRELGDTTVSTMETVQGNDGRPFLQDITTSVRTRLFERAYDYGLGVRVGRFYENALVRVALGADYEWGRESARQTTVSVGLEKFFYNAPYSIALNAEHHRKSGGFEPTGSDNRIMAMFRYEFGGPSYRPLKEYRTVQVPAKEISSPVAPAAPEPAKAVPAASVAPAPLPPAAPRTEKRLIKTTASMSADAFFEFDRAVLTPAARTALDGVITQIKNAGFTGNLQVTGNTCDIGPAAYNQRLSERRAAAVKSYLVSNGGIDPGVVISRGLGESSPKYPNTRTERHKNRRVDLEFVTYEDKVEIVSLPPEPVTVAPIPVPPAVAAPVQPAPKPAPAAKVEWTREEIVTEPTWVRRALRQSLPHKQTVDVYRQREQSTTVTPGEKRYINRPPIAVNDAFTVLFGSTGNAFDVLANDSDPDGDALAITAVGVPAHGTVVVLGGRVSYTPVSGFSGADTFTYAISDGKGGTAAATVSVTVTGPPNRPPVAQNDSFTVNQNSSANSFNVLANDSDPDGDALTVTAIGPPAHGVASLSSGNVSYTPTTGFTGSDAFTYTISDGRGGTASATVSVTIQPVVVNRPPVAQNDAYTVDQNSSANSLNVLANDSDPDGDALAITAVGTPAHCTATIVGNRISYTPAPGYSGADGFGYTISDGKGGTANATVGITIVVPALNRPPVAQDDAFTVAQDSSANSLNVLANDSDPDGDTLTLTAVSAPARGTAVIAGNRVSYTPASGFFGTDTFTYTIADGRGGTASATVTVTVASANANRPPVARDDVFVVFQSTNLDVLANDSDPDGDNLTITAVTQPQSGLIEILAGGKLLRFTMPFAFNRTTFTYTISDGRGGIATANVTLIDP